MCQFKASTEPQSFFQMIGNSFRLYKATFLKLLPFSILLFIAIFSLHQYVALSPAVQHGVLFVYPFKVYIAMLAVVLFQLYANLAGLHLGHQVMYQQNTSYGFSLGVALRKYLLCFVAVAIYFLSTCIAGLFLVIPGIVLMILLTLYIPLILLNDQGLWSGFKNSIRMVWPHPWRTLFLLIFYVGFYYAAIVLLEIIIRVPFDLMHVTFSETGKIVLSGVISFFFMVVTFPMSVTLILSLYHDLRLRYQIKMK